MSMRFFMPGGDVDWPFPPTARELRRTEIEAAQDVTAAEIESFFNDLEQPKDALLVPETGALIMGRDTPAPFDFSQAFETFWTSIVSLFDYGARRTGPAAAKLPPFDGRDLKTMDRIPAGGAVSSSHRRWGGRDPRSS